MLTGPPVSCGASRSAVILLTFPGCDAVQIATMPAPASDPPEVPPSLEVSASTEDRPVPMSSESAPPSASAGQQKSRRSVTWFESSGSADAAQDENASAPIPSVHPDETVALIAHPAWLLRCPPKRPVSQWMSSHIRPATSTMLLEDPLTHLSLPGRRRKALKLRSTSSSRGESWLQTPRGGACADQAGSRRGPSRTIESATRSGRSLRNRAWTCSEPSLTRAYVLGSIFPGCGTRARSDRWQVPGRAKCASTLVSINCLHTPRPFKTGLRHAEDHAPQVWDNFDPFGGSAKVYMISPEETVPPDNVEGSAVRIDPQPAPALASAGSHVGPTDPMGRRETLAGRASCSCPVDGHSGISAA